jgi:Flp pilus assembly protein TadB
MNHNGQNTEPDKKDNTESTKSFASNIKSRYTWLRLFFMLVVVLLYGVSRIVTGAVVVLQFFWLLFTGKTNKRLQNLGQALASYTYQIILYLTFNSEKRPFPFDTDWPAGPPTQ